MKKCWKFDKLLLFLFYIVLKIRYLNSTIVPPLQLAFDEPEIAQAIFHHYVTLKLAMDCWSIIIVQDGNFLYHKITSISFKSKIQMSPTFDMKFEYMYLSLNFNVVKFMWKLNIPRYILDLNMSRKTFLIAETLRDFGV